MYTKAKILGNGVKFCPLSWIYLEGFVFLEKNIILDIEAMDFNT
ncbi:hypothetical protein E9M_06785 [Moraxella catarrhalis 46P47B1]|nr:hypothetical protein EJK52_1907 [Moraxella catarrhalis]EGE09868.1 hypothetical protein E9G_08950 [Moraxella catarrhalis 7169]EGE11652.1 hypothetical protein E9M_06785 [Moraxella catarrhalis 46P47B1]EGE17942.1 hypothetical protein E9O_00360 [Moraxella catarrhalis 12P80B1]EGE18242.1 hypothetical protein E9U_08990 [Moraxella catarrhalis BC8]EGE22788.1 hypothetical protein E9W_07855 [Moraxella catarrhalis CO72]EKF82932.1 hypothetical protein MCRH_1931 [Moraxella catarrhalis RH4]